LHTNKGCFVEQTVTNASKLHTSDSQQTLVIIQFIAQAYTTLCMKSTPNALFWPYPSMSVLYDENR